jgi:hypothetical protein
MEIIIGVIIALIIGIWVRIDAKSRGMNSRFWGTFVFLLLIIGLPIYLIVRKPKLIQNEGGNQNSSSVNTIDKQQIIDIIKQNPKMSYEEIKSQAKNAGVSINMLNDAWNEAKGN